VHVGACCNSWVGVLDTRFSNERVCCDDWVAAVCMNGCRQLRECAPWDKAVCAVNLKDRLSLAVSLHVLTWEVQPCVLCGVAVRVCLHVLQTWYDDEALYKKECDQQTMRQSVSACTKLTLPGCHVLRCALLNSALSPCSVLCSVLCAATTSCCHPGNFIVQHKSGASSTLPHAVLCCAVLRRADFRAALQQEEQRDHTTDGI
jgi:hypothetical protein